MNYLKTFRGEAIDRLKLYREATNEKKAERDILEWLGTKQLESYRNGQASRTRK